MRSYKSIERPAQVLGMNLQDLGILVGLFIGSVLLLGFLGMAVKIPRMVYLLVIVVEIALIMGLRYLTKTQAPPPSAILSCTHKSSCQFPAVI